MIARVVIGQVANVTASSFTRAQAIAGFEAQVGDRFVLEHGQFAWQFRLMDEVRQQVLGLLCPRCPREEVVRILDAARDAADWQNHQGIDARGGELIRLLMDHRSRDWEGCSAFATTAAAFRDDRVDAQALFRDATQKLRRREPYEALFRADKVRSFHVAARLKTLGLPECFNLATAVVARVARGGGLRQPPGSAPLPSASWGARLWQGLQTRKDPRFRSNGGRQHLVSFKPSLPADVTRSGQVLDQGYPVRVGVQSGVIANKVFASDPRGPGLFIDPDHWLVVIHADGGELTFWDPDCVVTRRVKHAFGLLHHLPATAIPASWTTHYPNGCLGTGKDDASLDCDDDGYSPPGREKRYQALELGQVT